jgi:hypothetical protein
MVEVWVARARMGFVRVPWIQFGPLVGVRISSCQGFRHFKSCLSFLITKRLEVVLTYQHHDPTDPLDEPTRVCKYFAKYCILNHLHVHQFYLSLQES